MTGALLAFSPFVPASTNDRPWAFAPLCGLLLLVPLLAHFWGAYTLNGLLDPYEWRWRRRLLRPAALLLALAMAFLSPWPNGAPPGDPFSLCLAAVSGGPLSEGAGRGVLAFLLALGGLSFSHIAYTLNPCKGAALWGLLAFFGAFASTPWLLADAPAPLPLAFTQLAVASVVLVALGVAFAPKRRLLPYALLPMGLWALALSPAALALIVLIPALFLIFSRAPQTLLLNAHSWLAALALIVFGLPFALRILPAWLFLSPEIFFGLPLLWPLLALAALTAAIFSRLPQRRRSFLFACILALALTFGFCYGLPDLFAVFGPFLPLFAALPWRSTPPTQQVVHESF